MRGALSAPFPSKAAAAAYLAAMVDGEGHIAFKEGTSRWGRHVLVVNSERDIIDRTEAACDQLGLGHRLFERTAGSGIPLYELRISRYENVLRFRDVVAPLMGSMRKRKRLDAALAAAERGAVNDAKRGEVRRLRDEQGLTHRQIADATGVHISTVGLWLRKREPPKQRAARRPSA